MRKMSLSGLSLADLLCGLALASMISLNSAHAAGPVDNGACATNDLPPAAQRLGYTRRVFCDQPRVSEISNDPATLNRLYNGKWWEPTKPDMSVYSTSPSGLGLRLGGDLSSVSSRSRDGTLPALIAARGFYVEFAVRLSDNDRDHWPALWLMPREHDGDANDHIAGDPPRFQRWMELDVDEGGFDVGHHGALISWSGVWPNYTRTVFPNDQFNTVLDRTREHVFGLSYDANARLVTWWIDGRSVGSESSASIPKAAENYHYDINIDAGSHGRKRPYTMYVRYFSAYVR